MATQTNIVYVCDLCGSEDRVRTHKVGIDRRTAELEACTACWEPAKELLEKMLAAGRRVDVPTRKSRSSERPSPSGPSRSGASKAAGTATRKKAAEKATSRAS